MENDNFLPPIETREPPGGNYRCVQWNESSISVNQGLPRPV